MSKKKLFLTGGIILIFVGIYCFYLFGEYDSETDVEYTGDWWYGWIVGLVCFFTAIVLLIKSGSSSEKSETKLAEGLQSPDEIWRNYLQSSLEYFDIYDKSKLIEYFEEIGKRFENYSIVNKEEISPYNILIELRGIYKNFPIKFHIPYVRELKLSVKVDVFSHFSSITDQTVRIEQVSKVKNQNNSTNLDELKKFHRSITVQAELKYPLLTIQRDLNKVPKIKDVNDPWSKDDTPRIFLAYGVFIEELENFAELFISVFQFFSTESRAVILDFATKNDLKSISIFSDRIDISFNSSDILQKPLTSIYDGLDFLVKISDELKLVPVMLESKDKSNIGYEKINVRLVSCSYCTSKYPLMDECKCPNCGASYS